MFSYRDTEPFSKRLPTESGPGSPQGLGPICIPDEPLNYRESPTLSVHSSLVNIVTLYLGSKLNTGLIKSTTVLTNSHQHGDVPPCLLVCDLNKKIDI